MVSSLVKAFAWRKALDSDVPITLLSKRSNVTRQYITNMLKMTYLAPDIVEAILAGTQPGNLKVTDFLRSPIPISWAQQRLKYGFQK